MYKLWRCFKVIIIQVVILVIESELYSSEATNFNQDLQPNIWITISSVANKLADKSLIFEQIEINWINAHLNHEDDYIALYLDTHPRDGLLPVSVHRLNGQTSGQITTDYYLPPIDYYNQTFLREECVGYCIAYHSGRRIIAENCLKTNPTWMRDSFRYLKNKSLPALMIPGSHNSATYPKHVDEKVLNMINKYQQNQDVSIFNQLVFGIRYLDLRVGYSKVKHSTERFWIYHDIFRTDTSVREVLEQIRRFLELTSHELIIMDFHRFTVGFQKEHSNTIRERHVMLIDMILKELGSFIIPSYIGYHAPLGEYVSSGTRLLVGYADRDSLLDARMEFGAKLVQGEGEKEDDKEEIGATDLAFTEPNLNYTTGLDIETSTTIAPTSVSNISVQTTRLMQNEEVSTDVVKMNATEEHLTNRTSASLVEDNIYPPVSIGIDNVADSLTLSKVALFFPQIKHLWPNKDSIQDFTKYLNETTCRSYFGELKSLMVELTPTMFGVISDKYDGNRKLAESVNRAVTDMIREKWLHCVNIVASDYFLGNDFIRLSIHSNRLRATHLNSAVPANDNCKYFRKVEHLVDMSKIPPQFIQVSSKFSERSFDDYHNIKKSPYDRDTVIHWVGDGSHVTLKQLTSVGYGLKHNRERRDSFLDSISDGFSSLYSSFKTLLNL